MSDLSLCSLSELRNGLDTKKFSSRELTRALLDRMQKKAELNCFIGSCEDEALKSADLADKELANGKSTPLLGIPVGVKDVILTKGIKTTCASKILENFIPPYDATVTTKLKSYGAVIIGKTNMDEFAMGSSNENSAFGPVKNPWDTARVPGGSSGGSAAAVSARLCPVSLGTDTGGSIRQPASLCGIVGLKPTYGRVSRYGVIAYASSLDQVGGFARSAEDCALITSAISGYDPLDSTSVNIPVPNYSEIKNTNIKGLRIGIPKEYFISGVNSEVNQAVRNALDSLTKLGAELVEISLPHTELAVPCYYVLAPAEASSNLARYDGIRYGFRAQNTSSLSELYSTSRSEGFGREVKRRIMIGTYVLSSGYYDAYYLHAQKIRSLIVKDFKEAFEKKCDIIASPTAPTTAFPIGANSIGTKASNPVEMYLNDIFTIPVNLAGLPGISFPCGFDSQKLPIGIHLIGKAFDELSLLKTSYAYQQVTDWHKKTPEE
jgi:aspartyl-tRNA(Asn)/glutamyl-tRNA(Gln) amidotransferase subunit A